MNHSSAPSSPQQGARLHARDTIVYGIVPRNVGPLGLRSVTERIADLADLGVDTVWLTPINVTPPGDFGYAVVDYLNVRPDYGTDADVQELVGTAHAHGMRVMMDFVPNHTSIEHPWFKDASSGPQSPRYDWYDRDEQGNVTHYFNWTHLPNLNYDNPDVQQYMIDAFKYWVETFDIDGFRVDAPWGIRERCPAFWPRCCAELKRIKPDLLMLAEASARDGYYITHGFDAAYDWTDELGHWAWERVFDPDGFDTAELDRALTNDGRGYEDGSVLFRFINNNDTGERFITRHGPERTRLATTLLMTLPGMPCIFTGDEVGAGFHPYRYAGPIDWSDAHALRPFHKHLIALRRTLPSLRASGWERVQTDMQTQVYAYIRHDGGSAEPVLVILNGGNACTPVLELPAAFASFGEQAYLYDALADEQIACGGPPLQVAMPATGARILTIPVSRSYNQS